MARAWAASPAQAGYTGDNLICYNERVESPGRLGRHWQGPACWKADPEAPPRTRPRGPAIVVVDGAAVGRMDRGGWRTEWHGRRGTVGYRQGAAGGHKNVRFLKNRQEKYFKIK